MFELILNAAKLATSEEARKSASALVEFIRKSPEWQQDICTLEAKIPKEYEEQSLLLNDLTASKLENLEYTPNAINAFINVYSELTRNGFEYGCRKEKDSIKVIIEITKTYVSVSVINPKWRKFDVQNRLKAHTGFYESDLITERGRGLVLCNELADSLKSILNQTGIKAVIYKDRVEIGLLSFPGLVVMNILNGENNPSLVLKLSMLVEKHPNESIILHFNRETGVRRTDVDYFVRRRNKQNIFKEQQIYDPLDNVRAKKKNDSEIKVIILFTDIFHSKFYLPEEMIAHTWEEALAKLGKSDLLPIIFPPKPDEPEFSFIPKPQSLPDNDDDIFDEFREHADTPNFIISDDKMSEVTDLVESGDVSALMEIVDNEPDTTNRFIAAMALAQLNNERGVDFLISELNDPDINISSTAREILVALDHPKGNLALQSH